MPESPKTRLLKNKPVTEKISRLMHSEEFQIAADVALLQFVENQNRQADTLSASAAHFELIGAKRFLLVLSQIADAIADKPREPVGQLDHGTK